VSGSELAARWGQVPNSAALPLHAHPPALASDCDAPRRLDTPGGASLLLPIARARGRLVRTRWPATCCRRRTSRSTSSASRRGWTTTRAPWPRSRLWWVMRRRRRAAAALVHDARAHALTPPPPRLPPPAGPVRARAAQPLRPPGGAGRLVPDAAHRVRRRAARCAPSSPLKLLPPDKLTQPLTPHSPLRTAPRPAQAHP
jgi:hypothetical protein